MARSRFQRGSVIRIGNVWYGKFREDIVRPDGSVHRKQRKPSLGRAKGKGKLTRRQAERELDRRLEVAQVNAEDYRPKMDATFEQFAERWQTQILSLNRDSTQSRERYSLRKHLLAKLGQKPIREIDTMSLQKLVTEKRKSLAPKSIKNVFGLLHRMWIQARAWNVAKNHDPFDGLVLPSLEKSEQPFFTDEESGKIVDAAKSPQERLVYLICREIGIRQGELFGLPVSNIDLDGKRIHIRQSFVDGKIGPVKTRKGYRTILTTKTLAGEIRSYLQNHWKANKHDLLFANRKGNPVDPDTFRDRKLHARLKELGLPKAGLHALRHGASTIMDQQGVPKAIRLAPGAFKG